MRPADRRPSTPSRARSRSTSAAPPWSLIDMQRDFLLPGGFGETLGNDVSLLQKVVPPLAEVLAAARAAGMLVIHTREGHLPDLSDCPPAKLQRGKPSSASATMGANGRILIRGEYGHDIIDELAPDRRRDRHRQAGQGRVLRHRTASRAGDRRDHPPDRHRRDHRGLRAHHRAGGQRPRLRRTRALRLRRVLLPGVPTGRAGDGLRAGRDLRLGRRFDRAAGGR